MDKISPGFVARLNSLAASETVRVVLLLRRDDRPASPAPRSRVVRHERIEAIRRFVQDTWDDIDNILHQYGGRRLQETPDIFGSIVVETTTSGIRALTKSDSVTAIMEDQRINPSRVC